MLYDADRLAAIKDLILTSVAREKAQGTIIMAGIFYAEDRDTGCKYRCPLACAAGDKTAGKESVDFIAAQLGITENDLWAIVQGVDGGGLISVYNTDLIRLGQELREELGLL